MIVHVPITQEMIDTGVKNSCKDCPLAIGVRPYVKPGFVAHVTNKTIEFHVDPYCFARAPIAQRLLSGEATRFTREFDHGKNLGPVVLKIDFPLGVLRTDIEIVVDLVQEPWAYNAALKELEKYLSKED